MPQMRQQQQQQHEQMLRELEATAHNLHALLHSPGARQLLQQPPPAADATPAQQGFISLCNDNLVDFVGAARQLDAAAAANPSPAVR
uniref:Mediator of RNA polymerase II transcription subunit 21 n=1 Tax=Tetradesmus obliquus TaxID=3088 RepID=A0A383VUB4_TETOB|eukprot:jgi/Sobl393_1/7687/SZX68510.1